MNRQKEGWNAGMRCAGRMALCLSVVLAGGCGEMQHIYQDVHKAVALSQRAGTPVYNSVFDAARRGDPQAVEKFIRNGASVNAKDSDQYGLAVLAVKFNQNPETLRWLISAGADIKTANRFGATVLHEAVNSDNEAAVRLLLDAGADIEARDQNGETPFFTAAWLNRNSASVLLAAGANPHARDNDGTTALIKAATVCELNGMRLLLQAGVDVNAADQYGNTALMRAAGMSRGLMNEINKLSEAQVSACVSELLAHEADVRAKDTHDGDTALLRAAQQGYAKVAAQLIHAEAEVDAQNHDGYTPLMEAAKAGYRDVVAVLLQAGANPTLKDRIGRDALQWAADYPEIVSLLGGQPVAMVASPQPDAQKRAQLEKHLYSMGYRDFNQDSFVQSAVGGELAAVKAFLAYGLPVDSKSSQGHAITPLLATSMYADSPDIGLLLIQAGANVDAQDDNGATPLIWAAQKCHLHELVKALVQAKANVNAKAAGGATPLMMAETLKCSENIQIIKRAGAKK